MLATASECEFEVERGPDWLLVRIKNLDPNESESSLAEHLWNIVEQHFTYRIVLELDDVPTLHIRHVEQLDQLRHKVEQHDGMLRICGLTPHNRRLLRTYGGDEHLLPYQDRQEAILGGPHFHKPR